MRRTRKQGGFTIIELMLVLGIGAMVIAGAFVGYKFLSSQASSMQNINATTSLVTAVKNKFQGVGSYAGITTTAVVTAELVSKPLNGSGSAITNLWDLPIEFVGAADKFVAQVTVPAKFCIDAAGALDGIAYRIDIDTAGIAPGSAESATKTVKTAATNTIDAGKLTTQCGGATTVVTAFVK